MSAVALPLDAEAEIGRLAEPTSEQVRGGESLAELAYRQIEDLIVTMELKPGAWVSEPSLVERLGLGRTPIREALLRLSGDGLLLSRPRRGMVVREIDFATQLKAIETRRALELALVPAAARRRTGGDVEALTRVVQNFRRLRGGADHVALLRLDRAFVDGLIACARNPFMRAIIPLYALSRRFWLACEGRQSRFEAVTFTDFHIAIGEAVIAGDEPRAFDLARQFLDDVEAFTHFAGTELL